MGKIEVRKRLVAKEHQKVRDLQKFLYQIRKRILAVFILNDKERERLLDLIVKDIDKKLPKDYVFEREDGAT